ncbi:hypothetical protein LTR16_000405 [Cryomyces antarcticus]|uniref:Tubulin-specific chaperone A n=1 Tax=Cryomyces antarcticus TaxID=329879 RepID=A0ABR0LR31_9PEZI|nr:hypothetical protein LTR16_000405 [Cryomyces antarcticus]
MQEIKQVDLVALGKENGRRSELVFTKIEEVMNAIEADERKKQSEAAMTKFEDEERRLFQSTKYLAATEEHLLSVKDWEGISDTAHELDEAREAARGL